MTCSTNRNHLFARLAKPRIWRQIGITSRTIGVKGRWFFAKVSNVFPRHTSNDAIANRPQLHRRQQIQIMNTPTLDQLVRKGRPGGQSIHANHNRKMKHSLNIAIIQQRQEDTLKRAKRIPRRTRSPLVVEYIQWSKNVCTLFLFYLSFSTSHNRFSTLPRNMAPGSTTRSRYRLIRSHRRRLNIISGNFIKAFENRNALRRHELGRPSSRRGLPKRIQIQRLSKKKKQIKKKRELFVLLNLRHWAVFSKRIIRVRISCSGDWLFAFLFRIRKDGSRIHLVCNHICTNHRID